MRTATPIKTSILIAASILLFGVLTMAYGFFNENLRVTYLGIIITGVTSWAMVMGTFIRQVSRRLTSRSS
jgi:hypothetical protein